MPDDAALLSVLESLRERGALGEASLLEAVRHAEAFLAAIPPSTRRVIDLGSGGGLPGLVLAVRLPSVEFVLTDRRERRMDLLRLACARLGIDDRVTVLTTDVVRLGSAPGFASAFDVVTARAFGESMWTLRCAVPFLDVDGVIVVSEPPLVGSPAEIADAAARRWPAEELSALYLRPSAEVFDRVRRFERTERTEPTSGR